MHINTTKLLCHEETYIVFVIGIDYRGGESMLLYHSTNGESWSKSTLPNITMEYLHWLGDFWQRDIYHNWLAVYDHSIEPSCKIVNVIKTSPLGIRLNHPNHRTKPFCFFKDRMFILNKDSSWPSNSPSNFKSLQYYISKYTISLQPPYHWLLLQSHRCKPFEVPVGLL